MPTSRLYALTAIGLTLLYGVVGIGGPALHYLDASNRSVASCEAPAVEANHSNSNGYFHCHGPDYHWHHHHGPSERPTAEHSESQHDRHAAWHAPATLHSAHNCPLIAIMATMKLGSGGHARFALDLGLQYTALIESDAPALRLLDFLPRPRGPPPQILA